ncbi:MAG: hypothetical protein K0B16_16075 [Burkholderiaceae bacterium]|nr:hypothetical protein [Burkholderiaceae bacterium]
MTSNDFSPRRSPFQATDANADHIGRWRRNRLAEARAVVADVAHHSDHLIRLACEVLIAHGESPAECDEARVLQLVIDARRPVRRAQREDQGRAGQ